ncbi:MAG: chromosome segregation protein SMC [Gammaproteobacteria bacterium]|nr:chromosome segregation protein SMC [Gammaproteobacteria bacterium]
MRLRKIKLAGFKSFVDPTVLQVSDNLVGIVGPNGCGKSNIIDAVTWVMGESSAKHLRGEALTDVIFNGSGARQPVGQASVELVFDNARGKLGGAYAGYAEISIRRQLNRDAISTYFLNGTRCRRKDIQGIFLGTGLGPRSYSIIEQGVISRLIEARPEELRMFLEEAAGISRFRERRRETERRIRHTRDNISRLTDILEELEKQLEHLQRQARAAERFKALKQEERQLQAELLALEWQELSAAAEDRLNTVRRHENRVEAGLAALRKVETGIETQRQRYSAANEALNTAQAEFYQVGSDISQLEQRIAHSRERIEALTEEAAKAGQSEQALLRQQADDTRELTELTDKIELLAPRLDHARSAGSEAHQALRAAEQVWQTLQQEWDALQRTLAETDTRIEVNTTRKSLLQSGILALEQRRADLQQEAATLFPERLQQELKTLSAATDESESLLARRKQELQESAASLQNYRAALTDLNTQVQAMRAEHQKNENRITSLQALQRAQTLDDTESLERWLAAQGLTDRPRLIDGIRVEPGWEAALEMVLGSRLQDLLVTDLQGLDLDTASLQTGNASFLLDKAEPVSYPPKPWPRLIDMVTTPTPVDVLLNRIYLADSAEQAWSICQKLDETESVITRDGVWLNNYWVRMQGAAETPGALAREQELTRLQEIRQELQAGISQREDEIRQKNNLVEKENIKNNKLLISLNNQQEVVTTTKAQFTELKTRHQQSAERAVRIEQELGDLQEREQSAQAEIEQLEPLLAQDQERRQKLLTQQEQLASGRAEHTRALNEARAHWQEAGADSHALELQVASARTQKASFAQSCQRGEEQLAALAQRRGELEQAQAAQQEPLQQLGDELELKLAQKLGSETALATARETVQRQEQLLRDAEQARAEKELALQELRTELEQARIRRQETTVRVQTLTERLEAMEHTPAALLEALDEQAAIQQWQERLGAVGNRIQRLGAINLAAIDEYEQVSERKTYLDSQYADLSTALETLENAMLKIDKETRARFKETFERLNTNLQQNFPLLFGGGHAYLEMTEQNLLETGVTVMARPPGKKNSNIHLLSGGEKALTAVALVFSIFKLNPAPFCILDEVDAPLDDNNVVRFSEMVKAMSKDVQFIIVTHNKITMEITRQLLGVTMHEAGVSRLVSVDIDAAVEMAASA